MSYSLPSHLLRLFTPRPPLDYAEPTLHDKDPRRKPTPKRRRTMTSVGAVLEHVKQEAADRGEVTEQTEDNKGESLAPMVQLELRREQCQKDLEERQKRQFAEFNPRKDPHAAGDPFHTLFVARLAYDITEDILRHEFERYGPIDSVHLVRDKEGKSRGYAFILYQSERDQRRAFKDAEGIKIHGRRIKVDVERGRTVDDWKPKRLGGGLGGSSRKPKQRVRAEPAPEAFGGFGGPGGGSFGGGGGGFGRGGRGGGFRGRGRGGFAPRGGGFGRPGGGYGRPDGDGSNGDRGWPRGPRDGGYNSGPPSFPPRNGGAGYGPRGGFDRGYEDGPNKRPRY